MNANDSLTQQLIWRLTELEKRLGIQETIEFGSSHTHTPFAALQTFDAGLVTTFIKAPDADGLLLLDDGGNTAAQVLDGGIFAVPKLRSTPILTLVDDTATTLAIGSNYGFLLIMDPASSDRVGLVAWRASATNNYCVIIAQAGTGLAATTGALAGTTGTDGKVTISTHTNSALYVENRRGGTSNFRYLLIEGS